MHTPLALMFICCKPVDSLLVHYTESTSSFRPISFPEKCCVWLFFVSTISNFKAFEKFLRNLSQMSVDGDDVIVILSVFVYS